MTTTRSSPGAGIWIAMALLAAFLILSLAANLGLVLYRAGAHYATLSAESGGEEDFPKFEEIWASGRGDVKAVRIAINGSIFRAEIGGLWAGRHDRIEEIILQIRAAQNDQEVGVIILDINSPGGDITPVDEIYDALLRFKASREDRAILAFVRGMAASGGYYVAMAADHVLAEPTALVGSIGVIMQAFNWKGLSDKVGVTDVTIASGTNKDLLNPFRPVSAEHVAILQKAVDADYRRFVEIVGKARGIAPSNMTYLADGRIFSAADAQTNRLIDGIGYWNDALEQAATLANETEVKVVHYQSQPSWRDFLAELSFKLDPARVLQRSSPRLQYLYQ